MDRKIRLLNQNMEIGYCGPASLFKYRPFDEYTFDMLENNYLFLCAAENLDDKSECDTTIDIKRYIDGQLVNTETVAGTMTGGNQLLTIGHYGTSTYGNKESCESDVRVYCTALSDEDILKLYQDAAYIDDKHKFHCYELNEISEKNIRQTGVAEFNKFSEMA